MILEEATPSYRSLRPTPPPPFPLLFNSPPPQFCLQNAPRKVPLLSRQSGCYDDENDDDDDGDDDDNAPFKYRKSLN